MPLLLIVPGLYRARLWLEDESDSWGAATMVKYFKANSLAEAVQLARVELGLTPQDAARRLHVEAV